MKITKGTIDYMMMMLDEARNDIQKMKTKEEETIQSCYYTGMFDMACAVFVDYGMLIYDLEEKRHRVIEF